MLSWPAPLWRYPVTGGRGGPGGPGGGGFRSGGGIFGCMGLGVNVRVASVAAEGLEGRVLEPFSHAHFFMGA